MQPIYVHRTPRHHQQASTNMSRLKLGAPANGL